MSEPKRYDMTWGKDEDDYIFVSPSEQPKGRWVKWEDYERLGIEVQRLTIALRTADRTIKPLRDAAQKGGKP